MLLAGAAAGGTCSVAWRALRQRSWRSEGRLRPSKSNGVNIIEPCIVRNDTDDARRQRGRAVTQSACYDKEGAQRQRGRAMTKRVRHDKGRAP